MTSTPTNSSSPTAKKRVFSGVQPTGKLHLGNYLGAVAQWVEYQNTYDNIFCVVDLHAITIPEAIDPKVLHQKNREVAMLYLACGIDPERSVVFIQSHIKEHAELAWILNCFTPLGWLERMTQYKAKSQKQESVGTGLLIYPALQAADILLYNTNVVPVGHDQKQHIEITRDIAERFNAMYPDTFVLPEVLIRESGARIMGFDSPDEKMSKSVAEVRPGHAVGLLDDPAAIKKTIMRAVTDSGSETRFEHASPGVINLLTVYEAITRKPRPEIEAEFEGKGYGTLKKAVLEAVMECLNPVRERYNELAKDPAEFDRFLLKNADRIRPIAVETVNRVKERLGMG